ncbi:hypothetical protein ACWD7M_26015 [Streptomyces griseus]
MPRLIEQAHARVTEWERADWLKWGTSGMPMNGDDIAAHAEATVSFLRTGGWAPRNGRGIRSALDATTTGDETGRLSEDTRTAVRDILGHLICATTGAP